MRRFWKILIYWFLRFLPASLFTKLRFRQSPWGANYVGLDLSLGLKVMIKKANILVSFLVYSIGLSPFLYVEITKIPTSMFIPSSSFAPTSPMREMKLFVYEKIWVLLQKMISTHCNVSKVGGLFTVFMVRNASIPGQWI